MGSLVADRLRGIEASATLALAAKAKALRQAGKPVLDFTAGEPDFPTPQAVKDAAIRAIQKNQTKYTPAAGIPELRSAVAEYINCRLSTKYAAAEVMVSCGAKHVLFNALQAICEPGDEVIIPSPYWVSYDPLVRLADAKPRLIETSEADGFQPDPTAIERAMNSQTKAIILNSPSNPTGAVIEEQRIKAIAEVIKRKSRGDKMMVISDEIYDQIVFSPAKHYSIAKVQELWTQVILVNGVSKSYSMTGWRIGYAASGATNIIDAMINLQSHSTSNPTSISQYAALEALTNNSLPDQVQQMSHEFERRRDTLVKGLNAIPGLSCFKPRGAFYAWCSIHKLKQSADEIAARWLEDSLVAVVPGEGFGSKDHVRFSFATSMDVIDEGLARLNEWVRKH